MTLAIGDKLYLAPIRKDPQVNKYPKRGILDKDGDLTCFDVSQKVVDIGTGTGKR